MSGLRVHDVHKSFGETRALAGVTFEVTRGEILAVLGPSGCGKSTLLGVIAGLETPDQGALYWEGQSLAGVPPHRRDFGLMFQDLALFPHMNVFDNIAFGLRMLDRPATETQERVTHMLDLVGLAGFARRDVTTLSGGEQQRVALARSLAPEPRLLMLDEPLGSLDRTLREHLMLELRDILSSMHQTAIYVTHDQEEAFALADRVALMQAGQFVQIGTPPEIYQQPATPFAARFLGLTNLLEGQVRRDAGQQVVATPVGTFPVRTAVQGTATVLIRPDRVRLDGAGPYSVEGVVKERSFRGSLYRAVIEVSRVTLQFDFEPNAPLPGIGERVRLSFDPQTALQIFEDRISQDRSA